MSLLVKPRYHWDITVVLSRYVCVHSSEIQEEIAPEKRVCNDIGITTRPVRDRSKLITVANANRKNKELEQAARHRTRKFESSVFFRNSCTAVNIFLLC